jgi:4,5-DOPA dioxygenase extradiol
MRDMDRLPAIFVSHGAPTLALDDGPTARFLQELGRALPRPKGILVVSAHWLTTQPAVSTAAQPETLHDFGGFGPELEAIQYRAPGASELAARAKVLLDAAGLATAVAVRGLDHGAWVPLLHMYPDADVPVTQLAVQPRRDSAHHFAVGRALAPLLDEGWLVLASGGISHNLPEFMRRRGAGEPPAWVGAFTRWFAERLAAGAIDDVLVWRERAPEPALNHPTDEHLLPLFVALGAGGLPARRVHEAVDHAVIALDAYAFGPGAADIAAALGGGPGQFQVRRGMA